jgi:hypothetical protein
MTLAAGTLHRTWVRPRRSLVALPGLALAVLLGAAVEVRPAPAAESALSDIIPAFNLICQELRDGRAALQKGRLSETAFVDLVLDLFVRTDSLSTLFSASAPRARALTPLTSLARGFRYLKESLRANYEGIAARNGLRFVEADRSLEAALAWRSGLTVADLGKP